VTTAVAVGIGVTAGIATGGLALGSAFASDAMAAVGGAGGVGGFVEGRAAAGRGGGGIIAFSIVG